MVYIVVWKIVMKVSKCEINDLLKDILILSYIGDFIVVCICKCYCFFLMLMWLLDKLNFFFFILLYMVKMNLFYIILFSMYIFYKILIF